jgi:hypothetical protein
MPPEHPNPARYLLRGTTTSSPLLVAMRSPNRRHDIASLYKYLSAATAIAVLNSQALRYSSPVLFNDPFDVPRELTGFTVDQYEEAMVEQFRTYLRGEEQPKNRAALTLLDAYKQTAGFFPTAPSSPSLGTTRRR